MKKIAPIVAIALGMMFTSCKKKWTCECTATVNGVSTTASGTDDVKRSKKDAKALCEANNTTSTVAGATYTLDCKLK